MVLDDGDDFEYSPAARPAIPVAVANAAAEINFDFSKLPAAAAIGCCTVVVVITKDDEEADEGNSLIACKGGNELQNRGEFMFLNLLLLLE